MKNKAYLIVIIALSGILLCWCQNKEWNDNNTEENHRFNIAEWYCKDEWWVMDIQEEWDELVPICYYEDTDSYCYYDDLYDWYCNKSNAYWFDNYDYPEPDWICINHWWEPILDNEEDYACLIEWKTIKYSDIKDYFNEEKWDTDSVAEQYCIDNNWEVVEDYDNWSPLCVFNNNEYCEFSDIIEWICNQIQYDQWTIVYKQDAETYCTNDYTPICWDDWKLYTNKCWLDAAWVKEDKTAELTDDWCIYS